MEFSHHSHHVPNSRDLVILVIALVYSIATGI